MRRRFGTHLMLSLTLGLLASLALVGGALAAETTLRATLAGVMEGDNPGDPDGSGTATITLDPETGQVCWELTAEGIMPVVQSHIHEGAEGVSGGVVVPLDVEGFEGTSEGCVEDQDADVLADIVANPAGFYVNLHTSDFQAGAIRGQLAAASQPNTAVTTPVGTSPALVLGVLALLLATLVGVRAHQRG